MRFLLISSCCASLLLCFYNRVHSQNVTADSTFVSQVNTAIGLYHRSIFPENTLYNGTEYLPHNFLFAEGQPFFISNKPLNGSLVYKGVRYENVKLMYDLTRQQLVVLHPFNIQRIRLIMSDVTEFTLQEHQFLRVDADSIIDKNISEGHYQLLFNGRSSRLLKITRKNITEELTAGSGVLYFIKESNNYYIEKAGRHYPLSNRKSVLRAFADRKKEITQFLKTHRLGRGTSNEGTFKLIAAYYDQLSRS